MECIEDHLAREAKLLCRAVVQSESVGGEDDTAENQAEATTFGAGDWDSEYDNEGWRRNMSWLQRRRRNTNDTPLSGTQSPVPNEDRDARESVGGKQAEPRKHHLEDKNSGELLLGAERTCPESGTRNKRPVKVCTFSLPSTPNAMRVCLHGMGSPMQE